MNRYLGASLRVVLTKPLPGVGGCVPNDGVIRGVVTDFPAENLVPDSTFLESFVVIEERTFQEVSEELGTPLAGAKYRMNENLGCGVPDRLLLCFCQDRPVMNHDMPPAVTNEPTLS